jgi:hypothetical protein
MDEVAGKDTSTHKIAAAMNDGTSPASVNRWRKGVRPDAEKVVTFCRVYKENPVIGLIRAGYITEEEARTYPQDAKSTEQLLADMQAVIERRTKRRP